MNKRLYWLISILIDLVIVAAVIIFYVYPTFTRPWFMRWGATDEEMLQTLPGDEYIPTPLTESTRAITIQAPIEMVWPWVVQMGAEKGGFYSYTWIERLIQCPITNADSIHPEWQHPKPGDAFKLCPGNSGPPPYLVIAVDESRSLIVGHLLGEGETATGTIYYDTWAFTLHPLKNGDTRLIIRTRTSTTLGWEKYIEPGAFIMERGMLLGIRQRAAIKP